MSNPSSDATAFDNAAEEIFASIPDDVRQAHDGELVFIQPYADPSEGPLYVFGKRFSDVLRQADERFGRDARGEVMSLETADGSVPERVLAGLRGLR